MASSPNPTALAIDTRNEYRLAKEMGFITVNGQNHEVVPLTPEKLQKFAKTSQAAEVASKVMAAVGLAAGIGATAAFFLFLAGNPIGLALGATAGSILAGSLVGHHVAEYKVKQHDIPALAKRISNLTTKHQDLSEKDRPVFENLPEHQELEQLKNLKENIDQQSVPKEKITS